MKKINRIIGTLIGNTMEFYDFTVYAFLISYISKEFFRFENPFLSYIVVFGVFASGYLTRPLGALLFGYIGDKHGRSKALSISIIISTIATFSIGIIPSYDRIGIFSACILIGLRLLQGLAVSGEGGAIVLLFEKYAFKDKGFIGGSILASTLGGVILGSMVCALTSWFIASHQTMPWLWRLPFLLALPFGIVAIILRYLLNDFQLFQLAEQNALTIQHPTGALLKNYFRIILYSVSVVSLYSMTTSVLIIHFPYLLTENMGMSHYTSLLILTALLVIVAAATPLFGKLFSAYNFSSVYKIAASLLVVVAPLWFYSISIGNLPCILLMAFIFSLLIAAISSTVFPIFVGIFPFGVRYSGVALSFNLSITLFSSSTPMVMLFLEKHFATVTAAGAYIAIFAIVVLICMEWLLRDQRMIYFNQSEKELSLYRSSILSGFQEAG